MPIMTPGQKKHLDQINFEIKAARRLLMSAENTLNRVHQWSESQKQQKMKQYKGYTKGRRGYMKSNKV